MTLTIKVSHSSEKTTKPIAIFVMMIIVLIPFFDKIDAGMLSSYARNFLLSIVANSVKCDFPAHEGQFLYNV